MKTLLPALACSAALLSGFAGMPGGPLHSGIDLAGGDPAVRPPDDLYRHVNGSWVQTTEIPNDKSYIGSWESSTFGVKPGDGMYLPPEQRVSIW